MDCQSKRVDIEFIQGIEWNFLQKAEAQKKRILLVLDDLFDEAAQSKDFLALVIAGRHRNVHLMALRHNIFQRTKNSKTIDLNVTQIVLSNSPRDSEQIGVLGRQLGERHATMETYKRATQKPFVTWWLTLTWEVVNPWGILQIVPVTCRPFPTVQQINYAYNYTMSLQNFYVIDLYIDFPVTLKRCFILNCFNGIIKFFCDSTL